MFRMCVAIPAHRDSASIGTQGLSEGLILRHRTLHDITLDEGTLFTGKEVWAEHVATGPAGPLNGSPPDAGGMLAWQMLEQ